MPLLASSWQGGKPAQGAVTSGILEVENIGLFFLLFSDCWLPKEAYFMGSDMYQTRPRNYLARIREGDENHPSLKRTLNQLSYNVKPLLKKLIIKDMLQGEGQ